MQINRHNYEHYFLLYVDNELSTNDKLLVEDFVQQHPDLAVELHMLQQTVLPVEPATYGFDKSLLLKNEATAINSQNFEEQFLLYIDNELPANEKSNVETFVLQHPQHQPLFTQLKQSKLPIEMVECPNKEALLKEEKPARIIWMRFTKIAVAAVFIGLMATGIFMYNSNNILQPNSTVGSTKITTNSVKATTTNAQQLSTNNAALAKTNITVATKKNIQTTVTKGNSTPYNNSNINTSNTEKSIVKDVVENEKNNLPIKDYDALVSTDKTNIIIDKAETAFNNEVSIVAANNTNDNTENLVQQTVYKEINTNENDKSLYVGGLELNKDKLRGFFRKASKLLGSKAKAATTTDNNNAVATFALSNK